MDSFTINNQNKPQYKKSRPSTFSQGVVHKSDVGDFQGGYFVMVDAIKENQPLNNTRGKNNNHYKTNNTTDRNLERQKSEPLQSRPQHQQRRERSAPDFTATVTATTSRHGDHNVSPGRITSPSRSPSKNRRHSPNSQQENPSPSSPHKPRKAQHERYVDRTETLSAESGSPPSSTKGPSPTSSRWAGPAFSNAPPPSSLPLPEWTLSSQTSSPSPALPPSPAQPVPSSFPMIPQHPQAYFYGQPAMYQPLPAHYYPPYGPAPTQYEPSLDQLSMGLRRMLNIHEQQAQVIFA